MPPKTKPAVRLWESNRKQQDDIRQLVEKSVNFSQSVDAEREYLSKRAANAIEWVVDKNFLNQPALYEYWGSYRTIKDFFELRCPICEQPNDENPWGQSQMELESEILLRWSERHQDEVCPKCNSAKADLINEGFLNGSRTLLILAGRRSGKSHTLGIIGTYVEHVCSAADAGTPGGLLTYLGLSPGVALHMTFVASTDTQSKDTIWAKYRGLRSESPWFRRYVPWVGERAKVQETPDGMQKWDYSENDKTIRNGLTHLTIDSLNSNSHGIAGRLRVASFIDEICRMKDTDGPSSASEVYLAMKHATNDVCVAADTFGLPPWLGMTASASSPISIDDFGWKLVNSAKDDARMYARRYATWDYNPKFTREFFDSDMAKDRVGTMRDIGCQPPFAASPLIERPQDFRNIAVDETLKPTASFRRYEFVDKTGANLVGVDVERAQLLLHSPARYIAVDAGKNFDAFSLACAHPEKDDDGNTVTVYDWVIRLLTYSREKEIYFESVYQLLTGLTKHVKIAAVEFDHWNSTSIVQRVRQELGIRAREVATTDEHFLQFMRDAYSGYISMLPELPEDLQVEAPYKSAQGAAIYELLKLDRDPKTGKVYNPLKGAVSGQNSDDTARVCVHVHRLIQDVGFVEDQDDVGRKAKRKRQESAMADWNAKGRGQVVNLSRLHGLRK